MPTDLEPCFSLSLGAVRASGDVLNVQTDVRTQFKLGVCRTDQEQRDQGEQNAVANEDEGANFLDPSSTSVHRLSQAVRSAGLSLFGGIRLRTSKSP